MSAASIESESGSVSRSLTAPGGPEARPRLGPRLGLALEENGAVEIEGGVAQRLKNGIAAGQHPVAADQLDVGQSSVVLDPVDSVGAGVKDVAQAQERQDVGKAAHRQDLAGVVGIGALGEGHELRVALEQARVVAPDVGCPDEETVVQAGFVQHPIVSGVGGGERPHRRGHRLSEAERGALCVQGERRQFRGRAGGRPPSARRRRRRAASRQAPRIERTRPHCKSDRAAWRPAAWMKPRWTKAAAGRKLSPLCSMRKRSGPANPGWR